MNIISMKTKWLPEQSLFYRTTSIDFSLLGYIYIYTHTLKTTYPPPPRQKASYTHVHTRIHECRRWTEELLNKSYCKTKEVLLCVFLLKMHLYVYEAGGGDLHQTVFVSLPSGLVSGDDVRWWRGTDTNTLYSVCHCMISVSPWTNNTNNVWMTSITFTGGTTWTPCARWPTWRITLILIQPQFVNVTLWLQLKIQNAMWQGAAAPNLHMQLSYVFIVYSYSPIVLFSSRLTTRLWF